jgi:hypothetical protein
MDDRERRIRARAAQLWRAEGGASRHKWDHLARAAAEIDAEDKAAITARNKPSSGSGDE